MKRTNFKLLKKDLYLNRYGLFIIILYLIIMQLFFHNLCIFKLVFHFPCPGCGLTHAFFYLLKGNFIKSLNYNPSLIFWLSIFILLFYGRYINKIKFKIFPNYIIFVSLFTWICYIIKILNK